MPSTTRSTAATRRCSTSCPRTPPAPTTCTRSSSAIVDHGEFFELKPRLGAQRSSPAWRASAGSRSGSSPASRSSWAASSTSTAADKAARFIHSATPSTSRCSSSRTCPASWSARKVEKAGIIRHGAKMLYATSAATVPKFTVIMRKAYGAGYYVMCGRAYEPDLLVAWPTAEICVMGAEGAVTSSSGSRSRSPRTRPRRAELIEQLRQNIDPYIAAGHSLIDDMIDPRDTRSGSAGPRARLARSSSARPGAAPWCRYEPGRPGRHHLRDRQVRCETARSAPRSPIPPPITRPKRGARSTRAPFRSTSTRAALTARRRAPRRTSSRSVTRSRARWGMGRSSTSRPGRSGSASPTASLT